MKINILANSSEGNAVHIFTDKASILVEAGIPGKHIVGLAGTDQFDAVVISHEHGDHSGSAGIIGRRTGAPLYMHELVHEKIKPTLNKCEVYDWEPGEKLTFGDIEITNFSVRHDAIYTYGLILYDITANKKLCFMPDTGSWTKLMLHHMSNCDGYILDTDYDEKLLQDYEEYDDFLKERISSNFGHLSNQQIMELIDQLNMKDPEFIILSHLSTRTNSPEQAIKVAKEHHPDLVNSGVIKTAELGKIYDLS